ncbi:hypothetical protein ACVWZV_002218 [Bradyrhizobium sp. GM5.1]
MLRPLRPGGIFMTLDPTKNFAKCTVSTGYDASATSIALSSGHGGKLPNPSADGAFNVVWWNSTDYGDPADDPNVEIVRVTARSSDTLTVTRAQESTTASTKNTAGKSYKMVLALTQKMIIDIAASFFPKEVPTGSVNDSNVTFAFTAQPRAVVINGSTYFSDSTVGGSVVWTWSTPNATLAFPVGTGGDIHGIM